MDEREPVVLHWALETAIVTFNSPPLNLLGAKVRLALARRLEEAVVGGARRVVFTGAGRAFVAGADLHEFDGAPRAPGLNDILDDLSRIDVPTVAAINGMALGGGLEIALACRYRVARPGVRLGLPEVTIGSVPGAGGTQRLPRLVGMKAALDLIVHGYAVGGEEALEIGLIDRLADDPLALATELNDDVLEAASPVDRRPRPSRNGEALAAMRDTISRRMPGQIAPLRALELVEASAILPLTEAMRAERAAFLELRQSDQGRALRHIFFAERGASKVAKAFPHSNREIRSAVVVGGGKMGAAIAYDLARAGIAVTIAEQDDACSRLATGNVERLIGRDAERGLLDEHAYAVISGRITQCAGLANLPPSDLAIEAVFEDIDVKKRVLQQVSRSQADTAILATNTSYLDINRLSQAVPGPERFLGLHFFNPAHVMKLLEIVRGTYTGNEALGAAFALARRLGKIPIVSEVCDGFIGNRILFRYRHASDALLVAGALPEQVDNAMRAFGMAMGPFEAQDMTGLEISYANRKRLGGRHKNGEPFHPLIERLVDEMGRKGRGAGGGWYDYLDGKPTKCEAVKDLIEALSNQMGIARASVTDAEIARYALLSMIVEACDILEEGIARRPADIDLVLVHGYGFPRWRGGLMYFADTIGLARIVEDIAELAAQNPGFWHVPPLLRRLADEGRTFSSLNNIDSGSPLNE